MSETSDLDETGETEDARTTDASELVTPTDSDEQLVEEQEKAAAADAGAIGGHGSNEDLDPAQRPLAEAGEGESEGFEDAEKELIEHASHGDSGPDPTNRAGQPEGPGGAQATYGEADHEESSDDTDAAAQAEDES
ncbi:hypothetical protein BH10ACT11_BH10ACT11_12590 [soil metagenome]